MKTRTILIAAALATVATVNIAAVNVATAAPAPAPTEASDDDDDCEDIMDELKELTDQVKKEQAVPKSRLASCADTGQVLGIVKASRTVAAECYDASKKRDDLFADFDKALQQLEGRINSTCK